MSSLQLRLGVKRVEMGETAGQEDEQQLFGPRPVRARFGCQHLPVIQHCREGKIRIESEYARAQAARSTFEEMASIDSDSCVHDDSIQIAKLARH